MCIGGGGRTGPTRLTGGGGEVVSYRPEPASPHTHRQTQTYIQLNRVASRGGGGGSRASVCTGEMDTGIETGVKSNRQIRSLTLPPQEVIDWLLSLSVNQIVITVIVI